MTGTSLPTGAQQGNPMVTAIAEAASSLFQTIGIGLQGKAQSKQMQIQANAQSVSSAYTSHENRMNRAFTESAEKPNYTLPIALAIIGVVVTLLILKK